MLTTELKRKLAVKSLKTDVLRRQKANHQDIPVTYQFCPQTLSVPRCEKFSESLGKTLSFV